MVSQNIVCSTIEWKNGSTTDRSRKRSSNLKRNNCMSNNWQKLASARLAPWPACRFKRERVSIVQDIDQSSIMYISHDKTESNWIASDRQLCVPESKLDLLGLGQSTRLSMCFFVPGVRVGLPHIKNLMIENLKSAKKTWELEPEGENSLKNQRIFRSNFDLPNHYTNNIPVMTDSDFMLTKRMCAIAITKDVSFKLALAADL